MSTIRSTCGPSIRRAAVTRAASDFGDRPILIFTALWRASTMTAICGSKSRSGVSVM
jgi:hypothetical protein